MVLPIVPVGTNSAASLPAISAARASSRFTVGSSPYPSSPTSASAMARRISGVGRVTVSLRRSTNPDPPVGAVAGAMTSMLATTACGSPSLAAPGGAQGEEPFGDVGELGVHCRHPGEQLARQGDVPGPLVQIGQDVPLPEVTVTGIAEVAGRPRRGEHENGLVELPDLGQVFGQHQAPFDEHVGRRGRGAQFFPELPDPTVMALGAVT